MASLSFKPINQCPRTGGLEELVMPRKKKEPIQPREGAAAPSRSLVSTTPSLNNKQRLDAQAVNREALLAHPRTPAFLDKLMERALGDEQELPPATINKAMEMVGNVILGKGGDESQALQKETAKKITIQINGKTFDPVKGNYLEETEEEKEDRAATIARLKTINVKEDEDE